MAEDAIFRKYTGLLGGLVSSFDYSTLMEFGRSLRETWAEDRSVFIFGNGGSATNAMHFASDLFYGTAKNGGRGMRARALPANQSIVTCLANDTSYEEIFSRQLKVFARKGDTAIALSGSGNSPNVVRGLEEAKSIGMKTVAILGYSGGKCLPIADLALHFAVDDMQVSEDMQLIAGHMVTQWLLENPPDGTPGR